MYWNPDGIAFKMNDLRLLVQEHDVHVVLLCETKLHPSRELRLPNFFVYRRDELSPRDVPYRGTAVLVRRDLVHEELELPAFKTTRSIGVRLKTADTELKIYAAYKPPGDVYKLHPEDIRAMMEGATPTLVAGDLNAKHHQWGSHSINSAGRALQEDAENSNYEVLSPGAPTHYPMNPMHRPDVLDVALVKNVQFPIAIGELYDIETPHLPILLVLGVEADLTSAPRPRAKTDWHKYQLELNTTQLPGGVSTKEEVEAAAEAITTAITTAQAAATTTKPPPVLRKERLPPHLRKKLDLKRRLRRTWHHTRCPVIKAEINRLGEELRADIIELRGQSWERTIDQASQDDTALHRLNRSLTSTPEPVCPMIDHTGRRRYAARDRAAILADHFAGQFQPNPIMDQEHNAAVVERVERFLAAPAPPLAGDYFMSPREVRKVALKLNQRKAPGPDGVVAGALVQLPRRAVVSLTRLFNGILRTGHFPALWKEGKVIVIPKPGKDRRHPGGYRPITLLPHLAKLFERLLLRRILPHIQLRAEQHGFRDSHSTTLQLARVLHYLASELNRGRYTVGVFLDIEKAFDRVWHEGLLFKLLDAGVPPMIGQIVASFLEDRRFFVSVENAHSQTKAISAGVPQGSCLSPVLYALYTNDIPTLEGHLEEGVEDVVLALYADDSAYFASSRKIELACRKMQRLLDLLPPWLDKWRTAVNVGKTTALLTTRSRRPTPLQLRGRDIEWQSTVKYLGCNIDCSLRMVPMVQHCINRAKAARAMLRPVLSSSLPLRAKLRVYKAYVRSRLTYAAPAWYALLSKTQKARLQRFQNISLRVITGAGRYVRNTTIMRDTRMPTVEKFVARLARRMYDCADNSRHAHLHDIAPHHARPPEGRPLPRELLLIPLSPV